MGPTHLTGVTSVDHVRSRRSPLSGTESGELNLSLPPTHRRPAGGHRRRRPGTRPAPQRLAQPAQRLRRRTQEAHPHQPLQPASYLAPTRPRQARLRCRRRLRLAHRSARGRNPGAPPRPQPTARRRPIARVWAGKPAGANAIMLPAHRNRNRWPNGIDRLRGDSDERHLQRQDD